MLTTLMNYTTDGLVFSELAEEDRGDGYFPQHVHDDYEIHCITHGSVRYLVEGSSYELHPGSLIIIKSAELHKAEAKKGEYFERFTVNFTPEVLYKYGFDRSIVDAFVLKSPGERNLYEPRDFAGIEPLGLFKEMKESCLSGAPESVIVAYMAALLSALNNSFYSRKPTEPRRRDDFEKRLVDSINDRILEDVSLTSLSEELHMSASQINRIFKKTMGTSVYSYIVSKRLVMAQGMISRGERASEASQACGFKDYSCFYRLYKKRFGVSPTETKKHSLPI